MTSDAHQDESEPAGNLPRAASLYARVGGRVQGVGFRFFVLRNAKDLGLNGRVRNCPDGDVEVWAQGPRSKLQVFETLVRRGPPMSHVDHVAVRWGVEVEPRDDFIIGF